MPNKIIFLNYRREDSQADTRNIYTELIREFGDYAAFMDQRNIEPGQNWPNEIKENLNNADVVIAVIGPNWLTARYPNGKRRIDDPNDWVRQELDIALTSNTIIPVLLNGASVLNSNDLPDGLKKLANLQAITISSGNNWDAGIQTLLKSLRVLRNGNQLPKPKATLVLASESPRRHELLRAIGWRKGVDYFSVNASVAPCATGGNIQTLEEAKRVAECTAHQKVNWLNNNLSQIWQSLKFASEWNLAHMILIGVDTIVYCDGKIMDRPLLSAPSFATPMQIVGARVRAKEMLMEQKGKKIHIITGLVLAEVGHPDQMHNITKIVVTEAELRDYSEEDIDSYIACEEPFDKAGAFGIQGKGVTLFKRINGSYTNVVGLPLLEFIDILQREYKDSYIIPELKSSQVQAREGNLDNIIGSSVVSDNLSLVCVGDINYDFIYDKLPLNFFSCMCTPPGQKIIGEIRRAVGGTAINFAKGAKKSGFSKCYVVGVIGGDALGRRIVEELYNLEIVPIPQYDPNILTSIAIIVRDSAEKDTSLTLTDARQSLPEAVMDMALPQIKKADVFYLSGYCLTDDNRHDNALKMLHTSKDAGGLVVLDVVVGMSKTIPLNIFDNNSGSKSTRHLVDVFVSEMPEIFDWYSISTENMDELAVWNKHQEKLVKVLRARFSVAILRTSRYTHELVITKDQVIGPTKLDYRTLQANEKTGYGDLRTAKQVYSFLSPRIALASKSPQRFALLSQIVAPSKIQVIHSSCKESVDPYEKPRQRVKRMAREKAESVFNEGSFHGDIELILGADTEIICQVDGEQWELIGHPMNPEEALNDLARLNNKVHYALTGIAIIGKNPCDGCLKKFVTYEETKVTFINASTEQLQTYVKSGEPLGRAGAYAIQGLGGMLIKEIDGSYSNVVGLPLEKLSQVLSVEFGKPTWGFDKVSKWCFPDPIIGLPGDMEWCDESL